MKYSSKEISHFILSPDLWTKLPMAVKFCLFISLMLMLLLVSGCGQKKEEPPSDIRIPKELMPLAVEKSRAGPPHQEPVARSSLPYIQFISLKPVQPTRMDNLTAEVALKPDSPDLNFRYIWKINNRIVPDVTGNTLDLSEYQVRDMVSVTVIPWDKNRIGAPVQGPVTAIHAQPPTLELAPSRSKIKNVDIVDLQLVSSHPDCPVVIYSLSDPIITGMAIDPRTGKITWKVQAEQKGLIRFRASIEDDTHTVKVTKEFEVRIE